MVSVGTSPEEAAHAALGRLRMRAYALSLYSGWPLWERPITPAPHRR
jgi:hypothetical protein